MADITYASFEGNPTVYTPGEAWWFVDGQWREINSSEVAHEAAVMSQQAFEQRWPHLPPMPSSSLQAFGTSRLW
jgi:hypothetical protein